MRKMVLNGVSFVVSLGTNEINSKERRWKSVDDEISDDDDDDDDDDDANDVSGTRPQP
jgi:hypothetical protein